jgi:hypothetical protein
MKVRVKDTSYVRDVYSKAILNTNKSELNEYNNKKKIMSKVNDINTIKQDVAELRNMVEKLAQIILEKK